MRRLAPFLALLLLTACRCDPEPDPNVLVRDDGTALRVVPEPFAIELLHPDGHVTRTGSPAFAVGSLERPDPDHYYDPTYDDGVIWSTEATVVNGEVIREQERLSMGLRLGEHDFALELRTNPEGEGWTFSLVPTGDRRDLLHLRLSFETSERTRVWGLGEFFDSAEHHGRARNLRFDLSTETESRDTGRHVRSPNLVTHDGFGLLLENTEPFLADFEDPAEASITVVHDALSGTLFAGDDPLEVLAAEARAVGTPPLWPAWTFGPQLWRNAVGVTCTIACDQGCLASETGQDIVLRDVAELRGLDLPASVMWIDAPWESGFNTFEFNGTQFPDAAAMIQEMNAQGLRVVVWASPFVNRVDDSATMCGMEGPNAGGLFAEAAAAGYLLTNEDGQVTELPWRGTLGALVDFTNPAAFEWWKTQVRKVVDLGVDGFKLDFDEYVNPGLDTISLETTMVPFDGSRLTTLHGRYSALFHRAHYEALIEAGHEPYLIGRTGNQFDAAWTTAIWPGDLCNGFQEHGEVIAGDDEPHVGGLPAVILAGLSLSASLHPHFGSDIGGYLHGRPESDEAFIRWIQYGALGTVMQLGGGGEHHNPWDGATYGPEVLDAYRTYAGLHTRLFPYLYSYVARNSNEGTPILRPLGMQYPDDLAATDAPYQYLFGEDLLVAPVIDAGVTSREVTFPAGRWVQWFTGEVVEGPTTTTVPAPLSILPLYARAGALVPLLSPEVETLAEATAPGVIDRADREDELWLRIFPGAERTFCLEDGTCLSSAEGADGLTLTVSDAPLARTHVVEIAWHLRSAQAPLGVSSGGTALTMHADRAAFDAAAPADGAFFDDLAEVLWIRAAGSPGLQLEAH
ncbi:MAG: glycoside hydrolase family 31 protein [Deltaproteobacteria bacterium]|nr:glycoside hydrolase family 31 protein [Deltaproteobacteria bacterium]